MSSHFKNKVFFKKTHPEKVDCLELEGIELLKRKIRNGGCLVDLEVAYLESDELHLLELKMRHALPLLRPLTDALLILLRFSCCHLNCINCAYKI